MASLGRRQRLDAGAKDDENKWTTELDTLFDRHPEALESSRFGTPLEVAQSVQDTSSLPLDVAKIVAGYSEDFSSWIPDQAISVNTTAFKDGTPSNHLEVVCWLPLNNAILLWLNWRRLLVLRLDSREWTELFVDSYPSSNLTAGELPNLQIVVVRYGRLFLFCISRPDPIYVLDVQCPHADEATHLSDRCLSTTSFVAAMGTAQQPGVITGRECFRDSDDLAYHPLPLMASNSPPESSTDARPLEYTVSYPPLDIVFPFRVRILSPTHFCVWSSTTRSSYLYSTSSSDLVSSAQLSAGFDPWGISSGHFQVGEQSISVYTPGALINDRTGGVIAMFGKPSTLYPFIGVLHSCSHSALFVLNPSPLPSSVHSHPIDRYDASSSTPLASSAIYRYDASSSTVTELASLDPDRYLARCNTPNKLQCDRLQRIGPYLWTLDNFGESLRLVRWTTGVPPVGLDYRSETPHESNTSGELTQPTAGATRGPPAYKKQNTGQSSSADPS